MRTALLATLPLLVITMAGASPASARDYPYCLEQYGPVSYRECAYSTMEQCKMSASGRAASCYRDPFFPVYEEPRRERRRHYRHG
ncbi:DUF3551 domain-containing protein [Afipia sp. TerB]